MPEVDLQVESHRSGLAGTLGGVDDIQTARLVRLETTAGISTYNFRVCSACCLVYDQRGG